MGEKLPRKRRRRARWPVHRCRLEGRARLGRAAALRRAFVQSRAQPHRRARMLRASRLEVAPPRLALEA